MDLLSCPECKNYSLLEEYAEFVTQQENNYRKRTRLGCVSGAIVCEGAIDCQLDGRQCEAKLEQPIIPDRPEDCNLISPVLNIHTLDGFCRIIR